jgi:flagellar basal-body rod modification protein FlgD
MMQGAALVGKDVIMPGDVLQEVTPGVASGTFELPAAVRNVKVEVLSASGNRVLDTFNLNAQAAGRHDFTWPTKTEFKQSDGLRFRVTGQSGETTFNATELVRDTVDAVNTSGASLTLELTRSGHVPYSAISAID